MNTQDEIKALAAELTRVGKMPEWIRQKNWDWEIMCYTDDTVQREAAVLSALLGVAASEVLPKHGYMIVRSGTTDSGESDDEGNIIWSEWCWELYQHHWGNGDDYLGPFDSYTEAVLAVMKKIEKEK